MELKDRGITQVSINMTDYTAPPFTVLSVGTHQARRYGVSIVGSEILDLVPVRRWLTRRPIIWGWRNFDEASAVMENLIIFNARVVTPVGFSARRGGEMGKLRIIDNATVE